MRKKGTGDGILLHTTNIENWITSIQHFLISDNFLRIDESLCNLFISCMGFLPFSLFSIYTQSRHFDKDTRHRPNNIEQHHFFFFIFSWIFRYLNMFNNRWPLFVRKTILLSDLFARFLNFPIFLGEIHRRFHSLTA